MMGAKDVSKEIMIKHGVPVVPGFQGEDQDEDLLFSQVTIYQNILKIK
jgi:acetyl/propionyl-CoA carboxylase alpha subunit